ATFATWGSTLSPTRVSYHCVIGVAPCQPGSFRLPSTVISPWARAIASDGPGLGSAAWAEAASAHDSTTHAAAIRSDGGAKITASWRRCKQSGRAHCGLHARLEQARRAERHVPTAERHGRAAARGTAADERGSLRLGLGAQPPLAAPLDEHVLVEHRELDPPVQRASRLAGVRRQRPRRAVALRDELIRLELRILLQQVGAHGVGTRLRLLRQSRRLRFALGIGVNADLDLELGPLREHLTHR